MKSNNLKDVNFTIQQKKNSNKYFIKKRTFFLKNSIKILQVSVEKLFSEIKNQCIGDQ